MIENWARYANILSYLVNRLFFMKLFCNFNVKLSRKYQWLVLQQRQNDVAFEHYSYLNYKIEKFAGYS
ncbi:MAG: hypothetical protein BGO43_00470 [Gammaproteobacteria bacterium 39-13]|nr:MAG: hypothetical protein BGO43_00470 [Gammaproteobacteria bacterium 39-13]